MPSNGKQVVVYETFVRVRFFNEEAKTFFAPCFKNGYTILSILEIEFSLYFQDPFEFKTFSYFKADETEAKWISARGID